MKKLVIKFSGILSLVLFSAIPVAFAQTSGNPGITGTLTFTATPCTNNFCAVGANIIHLINGVAIPVLFAIAFIVFLWGIADAYIFSKGDPGKVKAGHQKVMWGIIAFVIMLSVWGLVNVVGNTLGLGGYFAPPLPQSY